MATEFNQTLAIIGIFIAIFTINLMWEQHVINSLDGDIRGLKDETNKMQKSIILLSVRVDPSLGPVILGVPGKNDTLTRNISIISPINNSIINGTFLVEGNVNLNTYDKIYIISKIKNAYWVLMDGQYDQLNSWKGAKDCLIPSEDTISCQKYEIFAIITPEKYSIGFYSDNIPKYASKSDSIYIYKCFDDQNANLG